MKILIVALALAPLVQAHDPSLRTPKATDADCAAVIPFIRSRQPKKDYTSCLNAPEFKRYSPKPDAPPVVLPAGKTYASAADCRNLAKLYAPYAPYAEAHDYGSCRAKPQFAQYYPVEPAQGSRHQKRQGLIQTGF
ncbi:hypothetical protein HK097_005202 [Rhizophlyctis rosea]|uniref:Uncharacterized protein n=1 Tax=Rhizophlyctis rosea TaxID=64517 RepID=A0AAD5SFE4_9FUNG|nr:hypothetical protein HK097_005202 [Rhizophlyctis rosea]